jgi:hypothetical protein
VGPGEARMGSAIAPGAESGAIVAQLAAIESGQESSRKVSKRRASVPLAERGSPTISGCQDELRGSAFVRRRSSSGVPTSCRRCSGPRPESLPRRLLRRCWPWR